MVLGNRLRRRNGRRWCAHAWASYELVLIAIGGLAEELAVSGIVAVVDGRKERGRE